MYKAASLLLFWWTPAMVLGFAPAIPLKVSKTVLYESMLEVKQPTEAEWVRARGAREWPQQLKQGQWSEQVNADQLVTRYILDGSGSVDVTLYEAHSGATKGSSSHRLVKGSLVEAMGPASLEWQADDQILLLTPGYEQGSLFALVAALFIAVCGALITEVGQ